MRRTPVRSRPAHHRRRDGGCGGTATGTPGVSASAEPQFTARDGGCGHRAAPGRRLAGRLHGRAGRCAHRSAVGRRDLRPGARRADRGRPGRSRPRPDAPLPAAVAGPAAPPVHRGAVPVRRGLSRGSRGFRPGWPGADRLRADELADGPAGLQPAGGPRGEPGFPRSAGMGLARRRRRRPPLGVRRRPRPAGVALPGRLAVPPGNRDAAGAGGGPPGRGRTARRAAGRGTHAGGVPGGRVRGRHDQRSPVRRAPDHAAHLVRSRTAGGPGRGAAARAALRAGPVRHVPRGDRRLGVHRGVGQLFRPAYRTGPVQTPGPDGGGPAAVRRSRSGRPAPAGPRGAVPRTGAAVADPAAARAGAHPGPVRRAVAHRAGHRRPSAHPAARRRRDAAGVRPGRAGRPAQWLRRRGARLADR